MDLIASGMSNQQIAAACFISKTVKNHINRISQSCTVPRAAKRSPTGWARRVRGGADDSTNGKLGPWARPE